MEEVAGISSTVGTPGQTPVDFFPFREFTRSLAEKRLIMSLSSIRANLASWGWVPQEVGRREDTHKQCLRDTRGACTEREGVF